MVTQPKVSMKSDLRTAIDIISVTFGILVGGVIALVSLWLWLDYQANPAHSLLAASSANLAAAMPSSIRELLGFEAHMMGLPLTGQTSAYWYMARAGGLVAYLLLWSSSIWGLTLSTKVISDMIPAPLAYGIHEFLSILAIIFAVLHAVVLLGDQYIQFNIFHLAIPFIAPYEPLWTGLGTIGLYLSAALTASFYIRRQIGQKVWRAMHYIAFVAYVLALVHGLMAGTDSPLAITKLMYLGTGFSVLFLTYYRLFTLKIREKKPVRK